MSQFKSLPVMRAGGLPVAVIQDMQFTHESHAEQLQWLDDLLACMQLASKADKPCLVARLIELSRFLSDEFTGVTEHHVRNLTHDLKVMKAVEVVA